MINLFLTQMLNGLQYGVLLFLLAAGLTLIFGIMDFVNLAHGSLYMLGAFFTAAGLNLTGSFCSACCWRYRPRCWPASRSTGWCLSGLYARPHLDQVLATFGLVLFFNELVVIVWGNSPLYAEVPAALSGTVQLFGFNYSSYRFAIIAVGLAVAVFLWWLINRTRIGMLIRAGASNAPMVAALGVDIRRLNMMIFGLGAGLAGLAGAMMAPIFSVQSGMGDSVLIQTLVVIIVGGHRLDPRRIPGGADHRHRRHHRSGVPADLDGLAHEWQRRPGGRAGGGLDAHLSADGRRARVQTGGLVSGSSGLTDMDRLFPETIDFRVAQTLGQHAAAVVSGRGADLVAVFDEPFYLTQYGRIMVYAIAASALNLLIGYTGLVSFGHALFLALGAYSVGHSWISTAYPMPGCSCPPMSVPPHGGAC